MGVDRQVEHHLERLDRLLALQLADRLGHELAVEVEPHGRDVTALRAAEQVARAADLEVAHGELEAGAEVGVLADRLQALVRLLGEHAVLRVQQVRVGALAAPSDPSAQLVQLREPEQVRAIHDERVHRGHVEPALHDRGADQHVVLAIGEVEHHALEPAFVHLPVRDGDARLGDQMAHLLGHVLDVLHPVVHEEDLTLAEELASDRLRHRAVVVLPHVREDRLTRLRRRLHEREVTDAGETHLERPRDRGGGEREHVDVLAEVLDLLLVLHPETLLLVDDEQAHVLELHVVGQQAVRADHDVDLARPQPGHHGVLLGIR